MTALASQDRDRAQKFAELTCRADVISTAGCAGGVAEDLPTSGRAGRIACAQIHYEDDQAQTGWAPTRYTSDERKENFYSSPTISGKRPMVGGGAGRKIALARVLDWSRPRDITVPRNTGGKGALVAMAIPVRTE